MLVIRCLVGAEMRVMWIACRFAALIISTQAQYNFMDGFAVQRVAESFTDSDVAVTTARSSNESRGNESVAVGNSAGLGSFVLFVLFRFSV
jgi:S-adenosylhomocysteine hydrolase